VAKPGLGAAPVRQHRFLRYIEHRRDFDGCKAAEEPGLDAGCTTRIEQLELIERVVKSDDVRCGRCGLFQ
jgi:hypothetical protein